MPEIRGALRKKIIDRQVECSSCGDTIGTLKKRYRLRSGDFICRDCYKGGRKQKRPKAPRRKPEKKESRKPGRPVPGAETGFQAPGKGNGVKGRGPGIRGVFSRNTQWEYMIVQGDPSDRSRELLNRMGSDNWEMVSAAGQGSELSFVFKRKV